MEILSLDIEGVKLIRPKRFVDERGFFAETYSRAAFDDAGMGMEFVQDNHSRSQRVGTIRGLHFQTPPYAQSKLVRVTRGRILDVAVDIRRGSPTFARHVAVELSPETLAQLFIPVGFAHGFCTLEPDTEVLYKVSEIYAPQFDAGILWNDPDLRIPWPVAAKDVVLSAKDGKLPRLRDQRVLF